MQADPQKNPHDPSPQFRCGYVAIIGEPNVGKSTLMNGLLRQKISIVTHKPQTTRHRILGILSAEQHQIIFLDTPGIITPRYALQEVMMRSADSAIRDADILLFMVDATRPATEINLPDSEVFHRLQQAHKPVSLLINKIDLVRKGLLLPIMDFYAARFPFREIFPISALTLEGTDALLQSVVAALPEHPPFFPTDIVSEHNERFFVSEIIREKIFLILQEEVPYATTVEIVEFKERGAGKWFISADVTVERDSQKGIVIGAGGVKLKEIGSLARRDIEKFLGHPVFLDLHVKVREQWRDKPEWVRKFGYET